MIITTKSGNVSINKRTPYGKWLMGYSQTNGWTGWFTLQQTWEKQKNRKPKGCSWEAWGIICGNILNPLYSEINELRELTEI
jgi:hypothetical protein